MSSIFDAPPIPATLDEAPVEIESRSWISARRLHPSGATKRMPAASMRRIKRSLAL
jgi:hypothetical protein